MVGVKKGHKSVMRHKLPVNPPNPERACARHLAVATGLRLICRIYVATKDVHAGVFYNLEFRLR